VHPSWKGVSLVPFELAFFFSRDCGLKRHSGKNVQRWWEQVLLSGAFLEGVAWFLGCAFYCNHITRGAEWVLYQVRSRQQHSRCLAIFMTPLEVDMS
jgi:hypothetical protein